ncbi:MAG: right-handed parallel beta-helix repeat-containing protein, partial [Bacteroidales bacterium]
NAIKGIQVDTLSNTERPMLTITNSRIENMTVAGIYAQSTTIVAANCLIANCGSWCAALTLGGSYEFYHCTLSNNYGSWYSSSARGEPTLLLNNFFVYNGTAYVYHLYNALFANCIITGSRPIEIGLVNTIDKVPVPGQFNYAFDHCLVKVDTMKTDDPERWIQIVKNHDPRFVSVFNRDYQLDTLSPAKDRGKPEYAQLFPLDLNGRSRLADTKPDIGAYEREE